VETHPEKIRRALALKYVFLAAFAYVGLFLVGCRPSQVLLLPPPENIDRIEGYASLRVSGEQGSNRSKFTFLFQLPHQGRIEVTDIMLGRTLYQIIMDRERAVFLVPSKRVYWEGDEEEIINHFLGFRLSLEEMINLFQGRWKESRAEAGEEGEEEDWILSRDEKGRVLFGQRGSLRFEVREFISDSPFPQVFTFQHSLDSGRVRILRLSFNMPLKKKDSFSLAFLANYRRVSWEEIEKILADEN
jgi:outer membrane biogenesis lipoprotein LolB